jgi:hypothetical protein
MRHYYSLTDPFTFETADKFEGQTATVITRDSGLQHSYHGKIHKVTTGRTKVGDDELFNECIIQLTEERYTVQFCPCGCTAEYTENEIRQAKAGKQFDDKNKLDAPILPTSECGTCQCLAEAHNNLIAANMAEYG